MVVATPICEWLDGLGVFGQRSKEKRVPERVFAVPDQQVRSFLRHLWATDGSVTVSEGGKACEHLLRNFEPGLGQRRGDFATDGWALHPASELLHKAAMRRPTTFGYLGPRQQRRFLEDVGVHGARSQNVVQALAALDGVTANTNVDTVPLEVWDGVREKMATAGVSHRALARGLEMQYCGSALFKSAMSRDRLQRVATVLDDDELSQLAASDVLWDEIKSIEPDGVEEVFDARVPGTHNFIADNVVVHNSGAIEQDADIVLFIYRHEYYHPEALETKGIAEVAIAKHRQGSVGRVDLTFLPEFTLFSDMGRDTPVI